MAFPVIFREKQITFTRILWFFPKISPWKSCSFSRDFHCFSHDFTMDKQLGSRCIINAVHKDLVSYALRMQPRKARKLAWPELTGWEKHQQLGESLEKLWGNWVFMRKSLGKPWENGVFMGNPWENGCSHGKVIEKLWRNWCFHGKVIGKPWKMDVFIGKP